MDKNWMHEAKFSSNYIKGVRQFMQFARDNMGVDSKIRCPCRDCNNVFLLSQSKVEDHLYIKGISLSYKKWIYHGEPSEFRLNTDANVFRGHDVDVDEVVIEDEEEEDDRLQHMMGDVYRGTFTDIYLEGLANNLNSDTEADDNKFDRLLRELQRELYPGCKNYSSLSFLVKLLHLKVYNRWSNKAFNMLLDMLKNAFPEGAMLPKSHYDAINMLRDLGLGYVSIHACVNDCVLYWNELKDKQVCPECHTSRWKIDDDHGKKIPHKILRYFPLKPRLQRLFMSRKTAEDMRWHHDKRVDNENVLRHPADGKAWKDFDKEFEWFAQEPRNVRLGLASDGFNPFGKLDSTYSMWPVILTPYNLPPWLCMKEEFSILSLLIPGPKAPGKDIDVYMRPLIDELNELWKDGMQI